MTGWQMFVGFTVIFAAGLIAMAFYVALAHAFFKFLAYIGVQPFKDWIYGQRSDHPKDPS